MIKKSKTALTALLVTADAAVLALSMTGAYLFHFTFYTGDGYITLPYYLQLTALLIPVYFILYHYFGMHDAYRFKSIIAESAKCVKANAAGVIFILVYLFLVKEVHVSRMVIALFACANTALCTLVRIGLRNLLRYLRKKGYHIKRLLLVGWNDVSAEFCKKVRANRNLGYQIIGYLNPQPVPEAALPYLGPLERLPEALQGSDLEEAVVSLDERDISRLSEVIDACEKEGVKSCLLPFYTKYLPTRPSIDELEGLPLINLRRIPLDNLGSAFLKRAFDIAASALGLAALSPLLLATAIGVKLSSPGPAIYKQERIGRGRRVFTMYKFRSMGVQTDGSDMTTWGTAEDERRTKFGEWIRKLSIDELPQLFNVLRGDMSLVGPRPERPYFVEKFKEEIPLYMLKHLVRPGITGWAQVNGWRGDTSIEERIKCDLFYIENWTFLLDVKILFLTVWKGFLNKSER